ncbi:MAG: FAD-dependent protein, partial [Verrucomicrobiota bacterium]
MLQLSEIKLPVDHPEGELRAVICKRLGLRDADLKDLIVDQVAIDARKKPEIYLNFTVSIKVEEETTYLSNQRLLSKYRLRNRPDRTYHFLKSPKPIPGPHRPVVIGSGPCGLFCALSLARMGLKPIILERGKMAGPRARDVTSFWRTGQQFNPESNVQFGEGGAGTFSDGKLYTQIKDRDNSCRKILEDLVSFGAPPSILTNSRPHIGTDKLITVLRRIREMLYNLGAEIRYETRVTDLKIDNGHLRGLILADGSELETDHAVLAVGHSARDVYEKLVERQIQVEPKAFSVGVRIEHPQEAINRAQFATTTPHRRLGSAPYKFAHQTRSGRGVYSFCMCPGGLVVGAASEEGGLVTNGMSTYARDNANANSGFMVELKPEDFPGTDPLAGIRLQRELEAKAFKIGGSNYHAPAQLLGDFLESRASTSLGKVTPSFRPGVTLVDLRSVLPDVVIKCLRESVSRINRRLPGFNRMDAVMTAVESRSSSPIRITRDPKTLQSISLEGLYPAGEGRGTPRGQRSEIQKNQCGGD